MAARGLGGGAGGARAGGTRGGGGRQRHLRTNSAALSERWSGNGVERVGELRELAFSPAESAAAQAASPAEHPYFRLWHAPR